MSSNASDYFEIVTDKAEFKKGGAAPFGAPAGARVESFREDGDWVEIRLSSGYVLSIHESRIAYILTRDAA